MERSQLRGMSTDESVDRFTITAVDQDKALLRSEVEEVKPVERDIACGGGELESREGNQRRALLELYDHSNPQVRLMAAKVTLNVAPESARRLLEAIAGSDQFPQAGDAGMALWALDGSWRQMD